MQIRFILIFSFLGLFACQSGTGSIDSEIASLEKAVEEKANVDNSTQLLEKYLQFVETHPEDAEKNSKYLYRAAGLQVRMNRTIQAANILETGIKDYKDVTTTPLSILLLAKLSEEKMKNKPKANALYRIFFEQYPDREENEELKARLALIPPVKDQLKNYMDNMYNDSTNMLDRKVAQNYLDVALVQVMLNEEDEESPQILHKAAETSRAIFNFNKAVEIYDWILEKYPNHEKTPQALFLKAFTFDNNMKKVDEARVLYQEFLKKYPDDGFADDTEFLLENLGKSDEEIIQSFEKKAENE